MTLNSDMLAHAVYPLFVDPTWTLSSTLGWGASMFQDAVIDQDGALRGMALVVEIERTAPLVERSVIDDGDTGCCDTLADATREGARLLAIEVALESVANCFVKKDARPAVAEHDRHRARGRGARTQIDERLIDSLACVFVELRIVEVAVTEAPAST